MTSSQLALRASTLLSKLLLVSGGGNTLKRVEGLMGNCDIYLDKVERFGENRKQLLLRTAQKVEIKATQKPQALYFKTQPDNSADRPFVPLLKSKPFGLTPLSLDILRAQQDSIGFFAGLSSPADFEFGHPYASEIQSLAPLPLPLVTSLVSGLSKEPSFTYVDSEQTLSEALSVLQGTRVLAFDLEHHSDHSFLGFTCLIQLSIPGHDFVIDALLLRDKIHLLAPIFADPSVLKVAHGATSDVSWLQRDFGVYVVNMLDTAVLGKRVHTGSISFGSLV